MVSESPFSKRELSTIEMALLTRRDFLKDHPQIPGSPEKLDRVLKLLDKVRDIRGDTPIVIDVDNMELYEVSLVLKGPHPDWRITHIDGKEVERRG